MVGMDGAGERPRGVRRSSRAGSAAGTVGEGGRANAPGGTGAPLGGGSSGEGSREIATVGPTSRG